jgi:hypothetical protein
VSFNGGTTPISKTGSYLVAMNNFMVDGGDNYTVFRSCTQPLGGEVDLGAWCRRECRHHACSQVPGSLGGAARRPGLPVATRRLGGAVVVAEVTLQRDPREHAVKPRG